MALTMDIPWITAVIPTYGKVGIGLTNECLRSLREVHSHLKVQVIVVDDGSPEVDFSELLQVCQSHNTEIVRRKENGGFAKACNDGLRRASGMACFLVNNDITFEHSPALQVMADTLRVTNCGVVGTRLLYPDKTIQHAGVVFVPAQEQPIPGYWDHYLRFQHENDFRAVTFRNSLVTGALMGISRNAIQMLGLLDERYGMAAEDIDYQLDVLQAGLPILYNGYTYAIHQEGRTRGRTIEEKTAMAPEKWKVEQEGLVSLFAKWKGVDWTGYTVGE